jgi:hypothetical protein
MPFQVYRVKNADRARMDTALGDDILSRQSLVIRDARHFGETGEGIYLFVEGAEAGILRADALLLEFAERAPNAAELHRKLKDEEDDAASGLGSIFG